MGFPHVFQRSRRGLRRGPVYERSDPKVTARLIAAQLGTMIDKATGAGLERLGTCLEEARLEAERLVAE